MVRATSVKSITNDQYISKHTYSTKNKRRLSQPHPTSIWMKIAMLHAHHYIPAYVLLCRFSNADEDDDANDGGDGKHTKNAKKFFLLFLVRVA